MLLDKFVATVGVDDVVVVDTADALLITTVSTRRTSAKW